MRRTSLLLAAALALVLGACDPAPVGPGRTGPVQTHHFPYGDHSAPGRGFLMDVRSAGHHGFDRVVLEMTFGRPGIPPFQVGYVDPPVRADGPGHPVQVQGSAFLELRVQDVTAAQVYGAPPDAFGPGRIRVPGGSVAVEVVRTGDFEASSTWVVGLTDRAPFAVAFYDAPPRLVVDVFHH